MTAHHHLPPDAYEARCARILAMKREGLKNTVIANRMGMTRGGVGHILKAARDRGVDLPPAREPSTRESRTGRPCGGSGRATDGGWMR